MKNQTLLLLFFTLVAQCISQTTFIFPTVTENPIHTDPQVQNTGAFTCEYSGNVLRASTWDGDDPSFAIEYNGSILVQSLNGNGIANLTDPDIVVDPRDPAIVTVIIAYELATSPQTVAYEAWDFNGSTISLNQPSTPVNSNTPYQIQPNIDVSHDGKVAIVYHNGFNTSVVAIPDASTPLIQTGFTLVDIPCILNCHSRLPDVAVKSDDDGLMTKVSISFIDYENGPSNLYVHSFDYALIGSVISCDQLDLLYTASPPEYYIGTPRIDGPDYADNSAYAHLNDYQVVIDVIEDVDIGVYEHILSYNRHLNSIPQQELLTANNFSNLFPFLPPWWTGVNSYSVNNPYFNTSNHMALFNCHNYLPATCYSNGLNISGWNYRTAGNAPYGCEPQNCSNNNYQPQLNYIGNDYDNILIRQQNAFGTILNPDVSVLNSQNSTEGNHLFVSLSGKYDPNNEVYYVWYDQQSTEIVSKSISNTSISLKTSKEFEDNVNNQALPYEVILKDNNATLSINSLHAIPSCPQILSVHDLSGSMVYSTMIEPEELNGSGEFPISKLASGLYLLTIRNADSGGIAHSQKVIIP